MMTTDVHVVVMQCNGRADKHGRTGRPT